MNKQELFFSVIIPTYNRQDFIAKTIQSVLAQEYPHFEVIVVDDGSTDDTENVVLGIEDSRVQYFKKENEERAAARNYGILQAKGDFLTFVDSDDLFYPNYLNEALKLIERYPSDVFFHLAYEMMDTEGKVLFKVNQRKGDLNKQLLTGNHLSCIGVFVKRDILLKYPFNEDRDLSGTEDWELWMRLASRYEIKYSNTMAAVMINHDSRSVLNIEEQKIKKRIDLALKYVFEDKVFIKKYGQYQAMVKAHLYMYMILHLAMSKQKYRAFFYFRNILVEYFPIFFTRKSLAIIKKLIF
jgi:glycosyltransferase involved in cell wall biosynthesis